MLYSVLLTLAAVSLGPDDHLIVNPILRQLCDRGVEIGSASLAPLPAPLMSDGLDAKAQREVIVGMLPEGHTLDRLARESVVAPHVLQMTELNDPAAPARQADCYFIAYGDLDVFTDEEFLQRLLRADVDDNRLDETGAEIKPQELVERGITISAENADDEAFVHGEYTLIKRVELHATLHAFWSRTDDSIVVAAIVDPRFADDPKYPNVWHPVAADDLGRLVAGEAHPYGGVGMYMKATRLAEPSGALFVEWHVVFSEPRDWFDGANLLGSKLPAVVQNQVRTARRELVKASREQE